MQCIKTLMLNDPDPNYGKACEVMVRKMVSTSLESINKDFHSEVNSFCLKTEECMSKDKPVVDIDGDNGKTEECEEAMEALTSKQSQCKPPWVWNWANKILHFFLPKSIRPDFKAQLEQLQEVLRQHVENLQREREMKKLELARYERKLELESRNHDIRFSEWFKYEELPVNREKFNTWCKSVD